jgi:Protein of unknown function (DUF3108)
MRPIPRVILRASLVCAALLIAAGAEHAQAQGKLDARYAITMTGISIGKARWTAAIGRDHYTAAASGRASGILAVLIKGEGAIQVEGAVQDGRLLPTGFTSKITRDHEQSEFKMTLEAGNVTRLDITETDKSKDRVPVTDADRRGIIDPVSAMLIPVAGSGEVLTQDACRRTLPIFDGRRRYDLALRFKRMDKVKADKGYQGAVVVCGVALKPIAGYRRSSRLVKLLAGRDIELWLAPIAGTRVLAPFRLSIASMVGNMVVRATQFEAADTTAQHATMPTGSRSRWPRRDACATLPSCCPISHPEG